MTQVPLLYLKRNFIGMKTYSAIFLFIKLVDSGHIFFRQFKIENIGVRNYPFRSNRFWNGNYTFLNVLPKYDVNRRFVIFGSQFLHQGYIVYPTFHYRAPGFRLDTFSPAIFK